MKEAETNPILQGTINKELNKLYSGDFEMVNGEILHH